MKINLHLHSNNSLDGGFDVNELIENLKKEKFNIVSITDHNTCEAYKELRYPNDIKIITGIEADAIINDHTYDFLCYDFDLDNVYKYALEKYQNVEKRQKKIFTAMVDLCKEKNIKLNNIDSYKPKEEYAHAAIYRMLSNDFLNKYNISNFGDLYRLSTMNKEFPLSIDMHLVWPDIRELLDVIHSNNGKVFLAHPYRYNQPVDDVLNEVKNIVDGIEICNNPKNKEEVEYLYKFAKDNNLLVSCGSDYHGDNRYSIECNYLTETMIQDILSWIK